MKIAIVHEWFDSYAGAEKVVEQLINLFPAADVFALVDFLPSDSREFIKNKPVTTTFIQNLPKSKKQFRKYLPLMPMAIETLDLSGYDVVISSSHCVAKGVRVGPNQIHISYVHSPVRYAWDLEQEYLREAGLYKGVKSWFVRCVLHYLRLWDRNTANNVDYFIANSDFIAKRIWRCYRRNADIIYPPVAVNNFTLCTDKEDFYLIASRMVPYKKINIIVEAFVKMPDKKLVVIGDGSEFSKIKAIASGKSNINIMGHQTFEVLKSKMQKAKAFIFAAEEDFGIAPVEAQACGTPVIAYNKGGVLESVIGLEKKFPTGIFYNEQSAESIVAAVKEFEKKRSVILPENCRKNAERFSEERFREEFKNYFREKCALKGIDM